MLEIKMALKSKEECSLRLPCGLQEIIAKAVPFLWTHGTAEITYDTGNKELDAALEYHLSDMPIGVKGYMVLAQALEKLDDQGKEKLARELLEKSHIRNYEDIAKEAGKQMSHWYSPEEFYQRWLDREIDAMRLTGGELFRKIVELAKKNGDLEYFQEIEDYTLPENSDMTVITDYHFDLCAIPNFGSSEGIYVDCLIQGDFGSEKKTLSLGTMKTLETSLDACKTMGEVCGVLLYHESEYVNGNIYRFMPKNEIESILSRPLTMRLAQEIEQTPRSPEMTM